MNNGQIVFRQRMNVLPQRTKNIFLQYANNVFRQQTNISPQPAHKYWRQRFNGQMFGLNERAMLFHKG